MERRRCIMCGMLLPLGSNRDKITCGAACRKRLSRARRKPSEVASRALYNIYVLASEAHDGLFGAHAYAELAWLVEYATKLKDDVAAGRPPSEWWQAENPPGSIQGGNGNGRDTP
jgi:hypothetical protein